MILLKSFIENKKHYIILIVLFFLEGPTNKTGQSLWYIRDRGKQLAAISGPNLPRTGNQAHYVFIIPGVNFINGFGPLRPAFAPCTQLF